MVTIDTHTHPHKVRSVPLPPPSKQSKAKNTILIPMHACMHDDDDDDNNNMNTRDLLDTISITGIKVLALEVAPCGHC